MTMARTTHCTICGSCYEAFSEEMANEHVRRCPRCVIVSALVDAKAKMDYAAGLMIRHGGECAEHGREMRGAARVIRSWLNEIGRSKLDEVAR